MISLKSLQKIVNLMKVFFHPSLFKAYLRLVQELEDKGFLPKNTEEDILISDRLIKNYKSLASDFNFEKDEIYKLGPIWQKSTSGILNQYIQRLERDESYGLSILLSSFYRTSGCKVFSWYTDWYRCHCSYFFNAELVVRVNEMYQKLQQIERSSKVKVDLYDTNKVGNPILVNINELNLHIGNLYYLAHVFEILNHTELDVNGEYLFVDLGAGNGNFIKLLLKTFPNSKAIIFDIPITLVFSSYYLIKNFPEKQIGLHSDIKEISCGLEQYDIICLPHFRIEELPVNSVDLFLNTGSLSEMNENTALHYLSIIKKTVKAGGYFYTYNHYHTHKRRKKSGEYRIDLGVKGLIERSKFNSFKLVSEGHINLLKQKKFKNIILQKINKGL